MCRYGRSSVTYGPEVQCCATAMAEVTAFERAPPLLMFGFVGRADEPDDRVLGSRGATAGLEVYRAVWADRCERPLVRVSISRIAACHAVHRSTGDR
jgi:hypothetical protein